MRCPSCNYEPTLSEIQSKPDGCSHCGVKYESFHLAAAERKDRNANEAARKAAESRIPAEVRNVLNEYPGAQPVVVIDINMSFGSMVMFMVKWTLAAIPALLILAVLAAAIPSILSVIGAILGR